MTFHVPEPGEPIPTLWTDMDRGPTESALDSETAVSLSCHLNPAFQNATGWSSLILDLKERGFGLEFQSGRLVLVHDRTGVELCTCGFLGHGFASLTARLGKPCVMAGSGRLVPAPT